MAKTLEILESDPAKDSDEGAELEVLATLIEEYEAENFPLGSLEST